MRLHQILFVFILPATGLYANNIGGGTSSQQVQIVVDPYCTRQIEGISALQREVYFGLCDQGTKFDQRCQTPEMYRYLVQELGIRFGRSLGPVRSVVRWGNAVFEDPARPGHVDLNRLEQKLLQSPYQPSEWFQMDMGDNLNVAAHGGHNAFPTFMGKYQRPQSGGEWLPLNIDAAAELSVATMQFNYVDFDRPAFYELVNEPHWSFYQTRHMADWHRVTQALMHQQGVPVKVGGPCSSVAYFYRDAYRGFNGMRDFIDHTGGRLDFYSFHVYDYLHWNGHDFVGRVTTGLPLEGVLDLVQNYSVNTYGHEVPLVISEHGGYISDKSGGYNGAAAAEEIARTYFPGRGFAWEMKKRSIVDHIMVNSVIANTLTFMDHPHVVQKAVPFILLQAFGWDPKYYAVLYVPKNYIDKSVWVPTQMVDFYRLFQGVTGRRVVAHCADPDVQTRAFTEGGTLWLVMNNLSDHDHVLHLNLPDANTVMLRRLQRAADFTPRFVTESWLPSETLVLKARETVVLRASYGHFVQERQTVNEQVFYGNQVAGPASSEARFQIDVPKGEPIAYATLRVGMRRAARADRRISIHFNGHSLEVPLEDCAERLDDGEKDYATCKFVAVDPALIKRGGPRNGNRIVVSFSDGKSGSVGSVVLRAAMTSD